MKLVIPFLAFFLTIALYSQEQKQQFLDVIVEGKEAYMSTTTGEVVFREHAKTDPEAFITDSEGNTLYEETKIHSVKKGEVLNTIAKKYDIKVEKLKKDNNLKSSKLAIGKKLKIKKILAVESLKPKMSSKEGTIIATLRPGENPAMLNVPKGPPTEAVKIPFEKEVENETDIVSKVEAIKEEVSEKTNDVKEEDEKASSLYTVKKGDTLFSIAKAHGLTVEALKQKNKLTSVALIIGQKLKF